MFSNKILAAILLLQVVNAFSISDSSSDASSYEVSDMPAAIQNNELNSTDIEELVLTQFLLPMVDIQRVQNFLFMVSMYFAKRLTYILMKYSMKMMFMLLTSVLPPVSLLNIIY